MISFKKNIAINVLHYPLLSIFVLNVVTNHFRDTIENRECIALMLFPMLFSKDYTQLE